MYARVEKYCANSKVARSWITEGLFMASTAEICGAVNLLQFFATSAAKVIDTPHLYRNNIASGFN